MTDDDESAGSSSRAVPAPVGSLREGRGRATPPETRGREAVATAETQASGCDRVGGLGARRSRSAARGEGERSRDPHHAAPRTQTRLLLDRLRPEQGGTQRRLRRSGGLLGCRGRRLRSNYLRSFSSLDLVLSSSFFDTSRQEGFKRSGLAVEAEPHHSLRGASRSLDAVARCGPNGLEIETETTRFIVRWTRV